MESIAMFLKWRNASYPANILFRCGDLKWQSSNSSICLYGFRCLRPIQKTLHMSIHCPNHPKSSHSSWICPIEVAKFGVGLPFSKSHFGAFWEPGGRWDWQRGAAGGWAETGHGGDRRAKEAPVAGLFGPSPEVGNHRNPPEEHIYGISPLKYPLKNMGFTIWYTYIWDYSYGYGSIPIDTFWVGWTSILTQLWLGVH